MTVSKLLPMRSRLRASETRKWQKDPFPGLLPGDLDRGRGGIDTPDNVPPSRKVEGVLPGPAPHVKHIARDSPGFLEIDELFLRSPDIQGGCPWYASSKKSMLTFASHPAPHDKPVFGARYFNFSSDCHSFNAFVTIFCGLWTKKDQ